MKTAWKLSELANLEVLIREGMVHEREREAVSLALEAHAGASEAQQRQLGVRAWYDAALQERAGETSGGGEEPGHRLQVALGILQVVLVVLSLGLGVSLIAGLVETVGVTEGKAYNVWKLLAVPVGAQWTLFVIALVSWLMVRKSRRQFTLLEELMGQIIKRLAGRAGAQGWNELYHASASYRRILCWRVARMTQWSGVAFNVGLIVGFYAILMFLEINFFWASTIEEFGQPQLERVTRMLSLPWSWWQAGWVPTSDQMAMTQLQVGQLNAEGESKPWYTFFLATLLVWTLVPRVLLTVGSVWMERRALGRLSFMEKRHRELWRQLRPVAQSRVAYQAASDGVVLIDVGGTEVDPSEIRPFLLQQLRVSPQQHFMAGVLEGDQRAEALKSLQEVQRGVVLLVDGWNLSPKQLTPLHTSLREAAGEGEIYYLVLGLPKNGVIQPPEEAEFAQWTQFISSLNDAQTEAISYNPNSILS